MKIELSKDIQASIERVFDVFTGIPKTARHIKAITEIEIVSETQEGLGTRWLESRMIYGQEAIEEREISAFNPYQSFEVVSESSGAKYHAIYTFTEHEEGTRVDLVFTSIQPVQFNPLRGAK